MRFRRYCSAFFLGVAALGLVACGPTGEHEPSFGDAWVAPGTLQVRKELTLRSPVSVVLHHGDHVDLLARRRRFIKIRASNGAEGWTDSRLLFSADAYELFDDLQERAAKSPSLGYATALDTVTVHTAPYRQAPALFQITPSKTSVAIIAHQRVERIPWDPPPLLDQLSPRSKAAKKKKDPPKVPPPPPGPPPSVPDDWLLLSGYPQDHVPDEKPDVPPPTPPVLDDWSLVRLPNGRAGWVLDRMLYLSIPDEVIQYAERARIVAYFQLGKVRDGDVEKAVWLWASQSAAARNLEFDSLRIFNWSVRRHRYETSWIERGIQGAGPVTLTRDGGNITGFRTFAIEQDGRVMRRDYALQNYRARITARVAEQPPAPWFIAPKRATQSQAEVPPAEQPTFWQKTRRWFSHLRSGSSH
jgi:SH3-like domain-containing protein